MKVREAFKALREERVKLIREKAKEVLGRDVEISLKDVDTDVNVKPDFNQLVTTNGIVSSLLSLYTTHLSKNTSDPKQSGTRAGTKTFWQSQPFDPFRVLAPLAKILELAMRSFYFNAYKPHHKKGMEDRQKMVSFLVFHFV